MWAGSSLHCRPAGPHSVEDFAFPLAGAFAGGLAPSPDIPIIRRIWTASFVLYRAGRMLVKWPVPDVSADGLGPRLAFPFSVVGSKCDPFYSIDLVRRGWLESVPGPSFRANVAFLGCPADRKLRRSRGNVLPLVTGCAPQDIPPTPNGVRNSGVKLWREILRIWMTQDPAAGIF
jgi:hypothetical protein